MASTLSAQEVPKIIQFKRTDYNAAHQNWMIAQGCEGHIYVANSEGILIYNGFKWIKIALPENQVPRAVFLGNDCKVYTGAFERFGYIDVTDPINPKYRPIADSLLHGTNQEIWTIFGNDEKLLFQSFSNLYSYNFESVSEIFPPTNIMLGKKINDQFFIPRIEQGLYQVMDQNLHAIAGAGQLPERAKIADIAATENIDILVLGTQYNGLFYLENDRLTPINSLLNDQLKSDQINKMIRLQSGHYAIGTILNGVYITEDFQSIDYHLNKSSGLSNNTVLSLFEDRNHDLWIGLDNGIDLLKMSSPLTYYYDRQGTLGTIFTTIHHNGRLYLGTNQGVFESNDDGSFTLIRNSQGQIWSFLVQDGDLLCGHNKGTFLIRDGACTQISDITGGWSMVPLGDNKVLQASYTGLVILGKKNGLWIPPIRIIGGQILVKKFILVGQRLVGYHNIYGIYIVDFNSDFSEVEGVMQIDKFEDEKLVEPINILSDGTNIFLPINSNLYKLSGTSFKKMPKEMVELLKKDPKLATQLHHVSAIEEISNFENISNFHFSISGDTTNAFIVGVDEGYLTIPHQLENTFSLTRHIGIDYLGVNGQVLKQEEPIVFQPSQKNIRIQLHDFSFSNHHMALKYKLENWDDLWRDMPIDGQLEFINVNDGEFKLYLADNVSESDHLIRFKVEPHWYESWPGILLYFGLGVCMLWYFNMREKKRINKKTKILLKENERELESERIKAKNEKLEREVIHKSKMLANSTLALVQKNKMLGKIKTVVSKGDTDVPNNRLFKQRILNLIDRNINSDRDWEIFEKNFAEVHEDFLDTLKAICPEITAGELRLAAYIKMNLSSKEISPLLNISVRSVENKRYRLRKKLGITHENNLSDYLLRL